MTYLRNGWEHLDDDENLVYAAIGLLARERRTGNTSQVASYSGLPRTRVSKVLATLDARGFITDTGRGSAHHWRVTGLPVPYSVADRAAARELRARQRELNRRD